MDPSSGQNIFVPPCGHIAGIWGRNDDTRGVHKAPANEVVRGAITLELNITKSEHDLLNPNGINCIRAFPGRGIRIWGTPPPPDPPGWPFGQHPGVFNLPGESNLGGPQWALFRANDYALWAK